MQTDSLHCGRAQDVAADNCIARPYNADGEVTATVDALGNVTQEGLDAAGEVTSSTDPLGRVTRTAFNADGEVTSTTDPLGNVTSEALDAAGEVTATTDPLGRVSLSRYDGDGQVTAAVDPLGNVTLTGYDADGERTSVTDAGGNVTTFAFDAGGRQTLMTDPLGHQARAAYDADGEVTSQTDRDGRKVASLYDAGGRQTEQDWYDAGGTTPAAVLTWAYDAVGEITSAADAAGAYALGYDAGGHVTHVSEPFGVALDLAYDADGERTLVADSLGGQAQSAYDAGGDLLSRILSGAGLSTLEVDAQYDAAGAVTRRSYTAVVPVGPQAPVNEAVGYDASGRVTSQGYFAPGGAAVAQYGYGYDPAGELVQQTDHGTTTSFGYDADGQLVSAGGATEGYDATGNRTSAGDVVGPDNQLLSDGTWDYRYDAEGNETAKVSIATGETWTYGYDDRNELTKVQKWSADPAASSSAALEEEVDYAYDAFGNRLEQDVTSYAGGTPATTVTRFALDGWDPAKAGATGNSGWDVWADLDQNGHLQARYLRGDAVDQLFARVGSDGSAYWTLTDRRGTVRDVTDATGVVKDSIRYDAFGNIVAETDATYRGRYGWDGREWDEEARLLYERARYYDPQTARWVSQDPLGFDAGDSNLYRYVYNQPSIQTDPSGLQRQGPLVSELLAKGLLSREEAARAYEVQRRLYAPGTPADKKDDFNREFQRLLANAAAKAGKMPNVQLAPEYQKQLQALLPGSAPAVPIAGGLADTATAAKKRAKMVADLQAQIEQRGHDGLKIENLTNRRDLEMEALRLSDLRYMWQDASDFAVDVRGQLVAVTPRGKDIKARFDRFNDRVDEISKMSLADRFGEVFGKRLLGTGGYESKLGTAIVENIKAFLQPANLAMFAGITALAVGATTFPPTAPFAIGIGYLLVGKEVVDISGKLGTGLALTVGARTDGEFDHAAALIADGLSQFALDAAIYGGGKAAGQLIGNRLARLRQVRGVDDFTELRLRVENCFAAGTPLLTPDGDRRIERFRPGDYVLSRSELDPRGSVVARRVEEVFVRVAPLVELGVGGRVIRTTAEHPFYVDGRGWRCASELRPGDRLCSHEGTTTGVAFVRATGRTAAVYNLRVAEDHTYFVGARGWGFSVWAHNADYVVVRRTGTNGEVTFSIVAESDGRTVASGIRTLEEVVEQAQRLPGAAAGQAPLRVPQGLTEAQFRDAAALIRSQAGHISHDIVVQGSQPFQHA